MTAILIGAALALLLLLIGVAIIIGGCWVAFKLEDEGPGIGVFIGGIIVGGLMTIIGGIAVGDIAIKLVKYNAIGEIAIDVLDAHGIEKICEHIDCGKVADIIKEPAE